MVSQPREAPQAHNCGGKSGGACNAICGRPSMWADAPWKQTLTILQSVHVGWHGSRGSAAWRRPRVTDTEGGSPWIERPVDPLGRELAVSSMREWAHTHRPTAAAGVAVAPQP
eukprot:3214600-Alexandrium_andersonii.AAC.1